MCKTPVTLIDLYPTIFDILSLNHVASEASVDGESLRAIANKTYDKDRCVLSEYHGAGSYGGAFMLRMGDYKYIYYVGHQPEVLTLKVIQMRNKILQMTHHLKVWLICWIMH